MIEILPRASLGNAFARRFGATADRSTQNGRIRIRNRAAPVGNEHTPRRPGIATATRLEPID